VRAEGRVSWLLGLLEVVEVEADRGKVMGLHGIQTLPPVSEEVPPRKEVFSIRSGVRP